MLNKTKNPNLTISQLTPSGVLISSDRHNICLDIFVPIVQKK